MQVTTVHYEEVTLLIRDKTRLQRTGLENRELLYLQLKGLKGALGCILFKAFSFSADNNRIVNNRRKNLYL